MLDNPWVCIYATHGNTIVRSSDFKTGGTKSLLPRFKTPEAKFLIKLTRPIINIIFFGHKLDGMFEPRHNIPFPLNHFFAKDDLGLFAPSAAFSHLLKILFCKTEKSAIGRKQSEMLPQRQWIRTLFQRIIIFSICLRQKHVHFIIIMLRSDDITNHKSSTRPSLIKFFP